MRLLIVCLLSAATCQGQEYLFNLVPDPGFEDTRHCPTSITSSVSAIPLNLWFSPTTGTPDLFSGCSSFDNAVPMNWTGRAYTKDGNNYVGMYVSHGYREYLTTQLLQPLQEGVQYTVAFFLRPAQFTRYRIDSIEVGFSKDTLTSPDDGVLSVVHRIKSPVIGEDLAEPDRWNFIEATYTAKGGESYLVLGNLSQNPGTTTRFTGAARSAMIDHAAYYLFDHVWVSSPEHQLDFPVDDYFHLTDLLFSFDDYTLSADAREQVVALCEFMPHHPQLHIVIRGHTDEKGSAEYNLELSRQRISSVLEVFKQWGISKARVKQIAYGEQLPISNADDENRRVEFRLFVPDS